jgi:hypothetical protein
MTYSCATLYCDIHHDFCTFFFDYLEVLGYKFGAPRCQQCFIQNFVSLLLLSAAIITFVLLLLVVLLGLLSLPN